MALKVAFSFLRCLHGFRVYPICLKRYPLFMSVGGVGHSSLSGMSPQLPGGL